jgi:hypothetical protein
MLGGCNGAGPQGRDYYPWFESDDPAERIAAITAAARANDRAAMPQVVTCLTDSEADVRLFAIHALRKMTKEDLGYRHYAPDPDRQQAARRWKDYLRDQATTRPKGAERK